jgi:hypothetical protein
MCADERDTRNLRRNQILKMFWENAYKKKNKTG